MSDIFLYTIYKGHVVQGMQWYSHGCRWGGLMLANEVYIYRGYLSVVPGVHRYFFQQVCTVIESLNP